MLYVAPFFVPNQDDPQFIVHSFLKDCMTKYPEFERLVRLQENQEEMESLKLTALLVTPIQRVPRFELKFDF